MSEHSIDVSVTPVSKDGKTFGAPLKQLHQDIKIPLSRGYVHISTHNHASIKYSDHNAQDAWLARWDNVGFDGPVIAGRREYEVVDALATTTQGRMNIGYQVADTASGPKNVLTFRGSIRAARRVRRSRFRRGTRMDPSLSTSYDFV